jgi:hypothetical protein
MYMYLLTNTEIASFLAMTNQTHTSLRARSIGRGSLNNSMYYTNML